MPRDSRAAFLAELDKIAPQIREAFERAIMDIRSTAQARAIEEAIKRAVETGDIVRGVQEVTAALQLGAEFFAPLDRAMEEAFRAGGVWQLSTLPKPRSTGSAGPLIVRFQGRHPQAEAWLREMRVALIAEISVDQDRLIRETLTEAVEKTLPYRSVTRTLLGRTEGNERKGGLIGLHSRQAAAVRKAREELGTPEGIRAYLRRDRRDRLFERKGGIIEKALREGRGLTEGEKERVTGRYADRLLRLRSETISRTEGNRAMNAGRARAMQQMVDDGKVDADLITKRWEATPGPRTRDSHRAMHGTEVKWGQPFISPTTGASLQYPHDENAPASETASCRCSMTIRTNWKEMMRRREARAAA